jgi:PAS domain S-box-containing protein
MPAGRYNLAVTAIVGVDAEGTIRWWNEDAAAWFGHAADDIVGRPVDLLVPLEHRVRQWEGLRRGDGGRRKAP